MNCQKLLETLKWEDTPLGARNRWPDSLRASAGICVMRADATVMFWGEEQIAIYNDAYAAIIGDKHPASFGASARKAWPNQWELRGKITQHVTLKGESYRVENYKASVSVNGVKEERYLTLDCSPIEVSAGVAGVFICCTDNTEVVLSASKLSSLRIAQLKDLFLQAPVALAVLTGPEFIVEVANDSMLEIWGRTSRKVIGKSAFAAIPEAKDQGFEGLLSKVMSTGERLVFDKIPFRVIRKGKTENTILKLVYSPLREPGGTVWGVIVLADEITTQVNLSERIEENEARIRMAVKSTGMGTLEYDIRENHFTSSAECRKICGIPDAEKSNFRSFSNIMLREEQRKFDYAAAKAKVNGTGKFNLVHRIVRQSDNSIRWIQSWGEIRYNERRQSEQILGTLIDITDERTNAMRQQNNEARMRMTVDSTGVGTFEFNADMTHFEISQRCRDLFGFSAGDRLTIASLESRIHPDDAAIRRAAHECLLKTGILHYEARVAVNNQIVRRIMVHGISIPGPAEQLPVVYGIVREIYDVSDISSPANEKNEAAMANVPCEEAATAVKIDGRYTTLQAQINEAELRNRKLTEFALLASEKLHESLIHIQAISGHIQSNVRAPEQVKYFDQLSLTIQRMRDLVAATAAFRSVDQINSACGMVDLNRVLFDVKSTLQFPIQLKKALIRNKDLPVVTGISPQIALVFENLIGNSIKFSRKPPIIEISSSVIASEKIANKPEELSEELYVEIAIRDNGIGFKAADRPRLFHLFQRLDQHAEFEGSGVGLALCRKIMEAHRGSITAHGESENGAEFRLYFPFAGQTRNESSRTALN